MVMSDHTKETKSKSDIKNLRKPYEDNFGYNLGLYLGMILGGLFGSMITVILNLPLPFVVISIGLIVSGTILMLRCIFWRL